MAACKYGSEQQNIIVDKSRIVGGSVMLNRKLVWPVLTILCAIAAIPKLSCAVCQPKICNGHLISWPKDFKGSAIVPTGVRHIDVNAFFYCNQLTSITLPDSLETIGLSAFADCRALREIALPETVTNIDMQAFRNCFALTNIIIRSRLQRIPERMCENCYKLQTIALPVSLCAIEACAFRGCLSLRNFIFPPALKQIGKSAFDGCQKLDAIFILGELPIANAELLNTVADDVVVYDACTNQARTSTLSNGYAWTNGISIITCSGIEEAVQLFERKMNWMKKDHPMGLKDAIRIAAEGFSSYPDDVAVIQLSECAMNLPAKWYGAKPDDIIHCFERFSSHSTVLTGKNKTGTWIVGASAKFGKYRGRAVAIDVEFEKEKVSKVVLSDGLKDGIRLGLTAYGSKAAKNLQILKWLD